jgi:hypothetical protein
MWDDLPFTDAARRLLMHTASRPASGMSTSGPSTSCLR